MDSLKTIQKIFRIFLRLTHAAKILCIVGTVLSGAGALCLMTSYYGGHVFDLFGKPVMIFHPDTNWKQQGVELLAACNMVGGQVSYRHLRCNSHGVQMYRISICNKIRCTVKVQLLL